MSDNPSIISHVSVGANDPGGMAAFYDAVLATLGATRMMQHGPVIAWGKAFPEFWVGPAHDGRPATVGNGVHFGFTAATRDEVDAFHAAALAAGGTDDGPPGSRPDYGPQYYGAFARDPEGNKIEASFWDEGATG